MVYKGRRKKTIHYYTIKSVEKVLKPRVLREVRTMHALQHPNVLHFHQWYETTNHLWLILEYCVGGDLLSLIRQDIRLPEASVHDFGRDLVSALLFLHSQGVLYCDLKPSNILLDENGKIKLGDFGLARRLGRGGDAAGGGAGGAGGKRGTPCYMAPELFQEAGCHSMASDLWALGCVLYECAAGHPPFVSSSFTSLVRSILEDDPKPLPNASPELHALLAGLLEKNPCRRLGWGDLVQLPFWKVPPGELPEFPPNRDFDAFVREAGYLGEGDEAAGGEGAGGKRQGQGLREDLGESGPVGDGRGEGLVAEGPPEPGAPGTVAAGHASTRSDGGAIVSPTRPGRPGTSGRQGSVDVLRLSQVVRENMEREEGGADYRSSLNVDNSDIHLDNPDAELDFSTAAEPEGGGRVHTMRRPPCAPRPQPLQGGQPPTGGQGRQESPWGGASSLESLLHRDRSRRSARGQSNGAPPPGRVSRHLARVVGPLAVRRVLCRKNRLLLRGPEQGGEVPRKRLPLLRRATGRALRGGSARRIGTLSSGRACWIR